MALQPFGFPFEVSPLLPPDEAKRAIRASKDRWFAPAESPRGWVIGPFICLWLSAYSRSGPMLLGWISQDNFGSRIRGRAGSDLNGVAYLALMFAIGMFAAVQMVREADPAIERLGLYFGPLVLVMMILIAWWAHKDRHDADPLVDFVRDSLRAVP